MDRYLADSEYIDWRDNRVLGVAEFLAARSSTPLELARDCFEWVRDQIKHSLDFKLDPVTAKASEVLAHGTGFCYAKSHLLAALLRANGIPCGLCYQRLSLYGTGAPYCLHGLNAVLLDGFGWYRVDPRGNRPDIDAQFRPPVEKLAFTLKDSRERDLPEIWPEPLPCVVEALARNSSYVALLGDLPDVELVNSPCSPTR